MLHRMWKPWFVYQPAQLGRRTLLAFRSPEAGYRSLRTSWGIPIIADPSRTIGRSILSTGVYDLAVSEALARLIEPGDTVIDAGANVGYMTVLASVATGPTGRVLSFEPHPDLFAVLQHNIAAVRERFHIASTELHQSALADQPGTTELHMPPGFGSNDGIARIGESPMAGCQSVAVRAETLDQSLGNDSAGVLKLDVEGFEPQVLRGSTKALAEHRVRHIVFEEHTIDGSDAVRILRSAGYQVFSLGWSMRGPTVQPVEAGSLSHRYEAPSFIATLEPDVLHDRIRPRGWLVLSTHMTERCF